MSHTMDPALRLQITKDYIADCQARDYTPSPHEAATTIWLAQRTAAVKHNEHITDKNDRMTLPSEISVDDAIACILVFQQARKVVTPGGLTSLVLFIGDTLLRSNQPPSFVSDLYDESLIIFMLYDYLNLNSDYFSEPRLKSALRHLKEQAPLWTPTQQDPATVAQFLDETIPDIRWSIVPWDVLYSMYVGWVLRRYPLLAPLSSADFEQETRNFLQTYPEWNATRILPNGKEEWVLRKTVYGTPLIQGKDCQVEHLAEPAYKGVPKGKAFHGIYELEENPVVRRRAP